MIMLVMIIETNFSEKPISLASVERVHKLIQIVVVEEIPLRNSSKDFPIIVWRQLFRGFVIVQTCVK